MRLDPLVAEVLIDWTGAACAGVDVNLFFPGIGENQKAKQAITICSTCPIRTRCLETYRASGEPRPSGTVTDFVVPLC